MTAAADAASKGSRAIATRRLSSGRADASKSQRRRSTRKTATDTSRPYSSVSRWSERRRVAVVGLLKMLSSTMALAYSSRRAVGDVAESSAVTSDSIMVRLVWVPLSPKRKPRCSARSAASESALRNGASVVTARRVKAVGSGVSTQVGLDRNYRQVFAGKLAGRLIRCAQTFEGPVHDLRERGLRTSASRAADGRLFRGDPNELRAMLLSADHALLSLPTGQQILQMLASLRRCLTDFALRYQPFGDQASPRKRQFCRAQESDT